MGKGVYPAHPPTDFLNSRVEFLFGRPVPQGVHFVETLADPNKPVMVVRWRTSTGAHTMDMENWNDDSLDALLVAMRMTCS